MGKRAVKQEVVDMEFTLDEDGELHVDIIVDDVPDFDGLCIETEPRDLSN